MPENRRSSRQEEEKGSAFVDFLQNILIIFVTFLVLFGVKEYLVDTVKVEGPSMEITLQDGDRLFMSRIADVEAFDIVVFPDPTGSGNLYIKRVIGLPGDQVEVQNGTTYVNGQPLQEDYLQGRPGVEIVNADYSMEAATGYSQVPEGMVFVMGDNRSNSKDSRSFGFIAIEDIMGVSNFRYWPLDKFGNTNTMPAANPSP